MNETIVMPTESYTFPQAIVEQRAAAQQAQEPYRSPALAAIVEQQGGIKKGDGTVVGGPQQRATRSLEEQARAANAAPRRASPRPSAANIESNVLPAAAAVAAAYQVPRTEVVLPAAGEAVPSPGLPPATSENEAIVLALPSNYVFYPFKDVYARAFKGRNLAKLSRAATEKSTLHLVEAVSSVLSSSCGRENLAFDLTMPDFYYVLYWLRLNSFTRVSYIHRYSCDSEMHVQQIMEGKLSVDSLRNAVTIKKADLLVRKLDVMVDVPEIQYPGVILWPCTMREALEISEDERVIDDEEFSWAAGLGIYLRRTDGKAMTLDERVAIVNDMSPDDVHALTEYDKLMTSYGIEETIAVQCSACGCKRRSVITLQAHDFFP